MNLNEYQDAVKRTAVYPDLNNNLTYPLIGLCGEVGEVAEHIKKSIRDDGGKVTPVRKEKLLYELSDVLWYLARLSSEIGFSLDEVAAANLYKLQLRKDKDKLHGEGSER